MAFRQTRFLYFNKIIYEYRKCLLLKISSSCIYVLFRTYSFTRIKPFKFPAQGCTLYGIHVQCTVYTHRLKHHGKSRNLKLIVKTKQKYKKIAIFSSHHHTWKIKDIQLKFNEKYKCLRNLSIIKNIFF